jgi:hypothetical protein
LTFLRLAAFVGGPPAAILAVGLGATSRSPVLVCGVAFIMSLLLAGRWQGLRQAVLQRLTHEQHAADADRKRMLPPR